MLLDAEHLADWLCILGKGLLSTALLADCSLLNVAQEQLGTECTKTS